MDGREEDPERNPLDFVAPLRVGADVYLDDAFEVAFRHGELLKGGQCLYAGTCINSNAFLEVVLLGYSNLSSPRGLW